jgi:Tfp pilus assembly protein PilE
MHYRDTRGLTALELLVVCAIITAITAIAAPLYGNILVHARTVKAQSDIRSLANATQLYFSHMGAMPSSLDILTVEVRNASGRPGGPFLVSLPSPPRGWSPAYAYMLTPGGNFTISAAGEGVVVSSGP